MTTIIGVRYPSKTKPGEFTGREYTYYCTVEGVAVGDILETEVRGSVTEVQVSKVGINPNLISPEVFSKLKTIMRRKGDYAAEVSMPTMEELIPSTAPDISENLIVLEQLPIITQKLNTVKADVLKRTQQAMQLVCTEENRSSVAKMRTELNAEFKRLDQQRIQLKKRILVPYEEFEAVFKECVATPYKEADADLKAKLDDVTGGILAQKASEVTSYYAELLEAAGIDWLGDMGYRPKVNLTVTVKALKSQAKEFVDGVVKDLTAIEEMANAEEILVEYKSCLDLPVSINRVKARHEALERERIRKETAQRLKQQQEEARLRTEQAIQREPEPPLPVQPPVTVMTDPEAPVLEDEPENEPNEVQEVPTPAEPVKYFKAEFWVRGTLDQLRAVKTFFKQEGIEYGTVQ